MTAAQHRRAATAGEIVAIDDGMVVADLGDGLCRAWLFVVRRCEPRYNCGEPFISDVVELEAKHRAELDAEIAKLVDDVGGRAYPKVMAWYESRAAYVRKLEAARGPT